MKKIVFFVVLLSLLNPLFAMWGKKYYVDDFGDSTDKSCLVSDVGEGTFSNSATTDSLLSWVIFIEDSSVKIKLLEYGSHVVKGAAFDDYYTVTIRDDNKKDYTFEGFSYGSYVKVSDPELFIYILSTNKSPRINIRERAKYGTPSSYKLGTINTEGLAELYKDSYGITLSSDRAIFSTGIKVTTKAPANTQVGDILLMGKVPDSEVEHAGKEVAWKVLSVNKTKSGKKIALVISEKVLTKMMHSSSWHSSSWQPYDWENSAIKKWLNEDFITSYGLNEIQFINVSHETESYITYDYSNPVSGEPVVTVEKVFLLSKSEAEKLFKSNNDRMAFNLDGDVSEWSLRTPARYRVVTVTGFGHVDKDGVLLNREIGVRPVFWILMED